MPTVAVVGGGFSGAMVASRLLGAACSPLRVVLIDRRGAVGRGVAYGTSYPEHLLNVPAGNMSAFAEDTGHFVVWARRRDPSATGGSFLPRMMYGEYIVANLREAQTRAASSGCQFVELHDEACAVQIAEHGSASIMLRTGESIEADRVVLALGNFPPEDPPVDDMGFYASEHYVRDPWKPGAFDRMANQDAALLIGTGLTMVDVAITLRSRGLVQKIHAISRHGLLPQPHRSTPHPPDPRGSRPPVERWPRTALGGLRGLREAVREAASRGIDWRDVITSIRSATPSLWAALLPKEQRRFLHHLRPFWDSHRHRAAPEPASKVRDMIESGLLRIYAGRLRKFRVGREGVEVAWQPRGESGRRTLRVASVINCTGPACDFARVSDPLVAQLRGDGLILPDVLGQGLLTTVEGAALDVRRQPSSVLFIAGPARRAQLWEHTAVPELRVHAASLAAHLLASLRTAPRP